MGERYDYEGLEKQQTATAPMRQHTCLDGDIISRRQTSTCGPGHARTEQLWRGTLILFYLFVRMILSSDQRVSHFSNL